MVNVERIRLWYRALLKATNQTTECLKDQYGRCCLGVACDVYIRETGDGYWDKDSNMFEDRNGECLPEKVQEWFGLEATDPRLKHEGIETCASSLNDSERLSFKEIAECVRETYLRSE